MSSTLTARATPYVDGAPVHHVVRAGAGVHPLVPVGVCVAVVATTMVALKAATGAPAIVVVLVAAAIGALLAVALTPLGKYRLLVVTDGEVVALRTAPFTPARPVGVVGRTPLAAIALTGSGDFRRVEVAGEQLWVHQRLAAPLEPETDAEASGATPA
jgi:hypothetical protein